MSAHVKDTQVAKINGVVHYGVLHNLPSFGALNPTITQSRGGARNV